MSWPSFSREINDLIFCHCAVSPLAQHNQIAVACRSTNVLWRRMHRRTVLVFLNRVIITLIDEAESKGVLRALIPLQDAVDVVWVYHDCRPHYLQEMLWLPIFSEGCVDSDRLFSVKIYYQQKDRQRLFLQVIISLYHIILSTKYEHPFFFYLEFVFRCSYDFVSHLAPNFQLFYSTRPLSACIGRGASIMYI